MIDENDYWGATEMAKLIVAITKKAAGCTLSLSRYFTEIIQVWHVTEQRSQKSKLQDFSFTWK